MDHNNYKLGLNTHGYDDTSPFQGYFPGTFKNMNTIFWAQGPSFKQNHSHRWIKMVDLYQVMPSNPKKNLFLQNFKEELQHIKIFDK